MPSELKDPVAKAICDRMIEQYGKEKFKAFLDSEGKDMPPIKLSAKELQWISGGGWRNVGWGCVYAAYGLYGAAVSEFAKALD